MLLMPPRHGKSELASRRLPAYALGKQPTRMIISASANSELANDFGRDVRNCIHSREYAILFPTRLAEDSQAKGRWHTADGGGYYAVGVGSDIMGRGAHIAIIDDPFGSMADARSEAKRKQVHDWYTGSLYNRLEEKGAIIIINHRMHEDDLTGMLLQQQAAGGDKWEVVSLKAIDDEGFALWPEKYNLAALQRIKLNTELDNKGSWSALYQQNPTPEEGTYFSADWLKLAIKKQIPDRRTLKIYGASDYAVTAGGGDYTVHVVVGIDPEDRMWLLDLWRLRSASNDWVEAQCDMILDWRPIGWAVEAGQIASGVGPFLNRRMIERKAYIAMVPFAARHDKAIRAQSIRGRMAHRGLYVPMDAEWFSDFRSEIVAFPAGKHDDQVDALGLIGQILDRMAVGTPLEEEKPPKILSTDPSVCTVTLDDVWEAEDGKRRPSVIRRVS